MNVIPLFKSVKNFFKKVLAKSLRLAYNNTCVRDDG